MTEIFRDIDFLTVTEGYNVTITAEDADSSITLDEQTFEVEGEGTATRLFKLKNAEDAARTLTFYENFTVGDGYAGTLTFAATATTITVSSTASVGGTNTGDITLATNHGLGLTNQVLSMGTPSSITGASTNSVSTTTHTHALDLSAPPAMGATTPSTIKGSTIDATTDITLIGSTGGLVRKFYEATANITAAASITITLNIPTNALILGCQLRVDAALTATELWDAAYSGGSTESIATAQAVAQNTKVNSFVTDITDNTTNIAITKNGGGSFTAQGTIRAIVYAEIFDAMGDV